MVALLGESFYLVFVVSSTFCCAKVVPLKRRASSFFSDL